MLSKLKWFPVGLLALSGTCVAQSIADAYPSKPVQVVIPFPTGGVTDIEARMFMQKVSESTGRPFVLDFKPGAGSTMGTALVAKSAPDGYTLLVITTGYTVAPAFYRNLTYDPVKDLAAVSLLTSRPSLMVVNSLLPVKSIGEYLAFAKASPGKINFGTPGSGSAPHLGGEWLHSLTGTKATFVHYKGTAQMVLDVVAGRLDATISVPTTLLAQVKAGKLRAIATASIDRSALLPDLPTISEQAVPGFDYSSWLGVVAPTATPGAIISKLNAELAKAARAPDIIQKLAIDGTNSVGGPADQFRKLIVSEVDRWRKLVQETGIKLDQ